MIVPQIDNELSSELNCISFSEEIEFAVLEKRADGYMHAIIQFCEDHGFEYSEILKFISPSLKEKIQLEAEDQGLVKKTSRTVWEL